MQNESEVLGESIRDKCVWLIEQQVNENILLIKIFVFSHLKRSILGGVTLSPRPDIRCKQNISDFSVCGTDQKEVMIDENYCLSVDHLGRPVDIYHDPDYIMRCIGFFKENLKSYLITYDDLDPLSVSRFEQNSFRVLNIRNN